MRAYSDVYLEDVVEEQGKLFDFVAQSFPNTDTEEFITSYMKSKTRAAIDVGHAYVNTMFAKELWRYFTSTEGYSLKPGKNLDGFMPAWIGEFYAYYQWYYNIPSAELIKKIPLDFLKKAYYGLHDLQLELAVQKVGEVPDKTVTHRRQLDILHLQSECLLGVSKVLKKSLAECADLFQEHGIFDYISTCYEVLHLSGVEYVVEDILTRIKGSE